ncbi:MAG: penicillin-binding protein 2 [Cyanobacteria bacterium P01_A01_bin.135]
MHRAPYRRRAAGRQQPRAAVRPAVRRLAQQRLRQPPQPALPPRQRSSAFTLRPTLRRVKRPITRCHRGRLVCTWLLLVLAIAGLGTRLFHLQIIQANMLQQRAEGQRRVPVTPLSARRPVVDRHDRVVAIDRQVYTLYAHPRLFPDSSSEALDDIAGKLAPILEQEASAIRSLLGSAETGVKLAEGLSRDAASQIREFYLDGLDLAQQPERFYPHAGALVSVLGYVNDDGEGHAGVEQTYQDRLVQPFEAAEIMLGGNGAAVSGAVPMALLQRDDLQLRLTVDSRLQHVASQALQAQVETFSATKGAVLVMDAHSGALRVMATTPTYDPNQFYAADPEQLKNWVLTDLYEPGSTFKPINVAIALEAGYLQPGDQVHDEGHIVIGEWPIENSDYDVAGSRGDISVSEVMQYSSNVGMVRIMQRLPREEYYQWLEKLGLPESTGVDLPLEATSILKSREQFTSSTVEAATTAFGQGFSLSPMHLMQLHGAIANGGNLVTPHVAEGLVDSRGIPQWQPQRPAPRRIFSAKTSQAVLAMMEDVVTLGTGKSAQIPGHRIGGKTGTAQKASATGGYSDSRVTSFISMLPADNPRYVVLVLVDEPQGSEAYGSTVAAPVAKQVMEALIVMEGLPRQPQ